MCIRDSWEIKQYYPSEFKVGVQSLSILRKMLGIELPVDEAAFIALHFITAEYDTTMDAVSYTHLDVYKRQGWKYCHYSDKAMG